VLKISYGMGVDSTAMLVGMRQRGIRPDVIMFANTKGEKRRTYAYRAIIDAWLERVGFPAIIEVAYEPTRAPYTTLEEKCFANETLPSLAFGGHSCSTIFKKDQQEKFLSTYPPAMEVWARGEKVVVAIGYDCGPRDSRRSKIKDDDRYSYCYLLQQWGWDREECERQILAAGLPLPPKSSCTFCPAMRREEVIELKREEPDKFRRGVAMEINARQGKHGLTSAAGLGRHWSWLELADRTDIPSEIRVTKLGIGKIDIEIVYEPHEPGTVPTTIVNGSAASVIPGRIAPPGQEVEEVEEV